MLDTLSLLEELSLQFPMCCPPSGFFLDQIHSHLKRFSFACSALCDDSDFLEQHPGLESLFLDTEQGLSTDTNTPPCQLLRALNVDDSALSLPPTLLDCPITHLWLWEVEKSMEIPIFDTLRCLELDIRNTCDDPIPPSVITFLRNVPVLDELGIIRNGPLSLPHGWSDSLV
ncbi:hypothetical protein B0H14DRAFT_3480427 [Mycena olivaceomarginata]|nr:hypothetical protein B0H14DRAFT_3480427 [Mycena olivaceomarginata]